MHFSYNDFTSKASYYLDKVLIMLNSREAKAIPLAENAAKTKP